MIQTYPYPFNRCVKSLPDPPPAKARNVKDIENKKHVNDYSWLTEAINNLKKCFHLCNSCSKKFSYMRKLATDSNVHYEYNLNGKKAKADLKEQLHWGKNKVGVPERQDHNTFNDVIHRYIGKKNVNRNKISSNICYNSTSGHVSDDSDVTCIKNNILKVNNRKRNNIGSNHTTDSVKPIQSSNIIFSNTLYPTENETLTFNKDVYIFVKNGRKEKLSSNRSLNFEGLINRTTEEDEEEEEKQNENSCSHVENATALNNHDAMLSSNTPDDMIIHIKRHFKNSIYYFACEHIRSCDLYDMKEEDSDYDSIYVYVCDSEQFSPMSNYVLNLKKGNEIIRLPQPDHLLQMDNEGEKEKAYRNNKSRSNALRNNINDNDSKGNTKNNNKNKENVFHCRENSEESTKNVFSLFPSETTNNATIERKENNDSAKSKIYYKACKRFDEPASNYSEIIFEEIMNNNDSSIFDKSGKKSILPFSKNSEIKGNRELRSLNTQKERNYSNCNKKNVEKRGINNDIYRNGNQGKETNTRENDWCKTQIGIEKKNGINHNNKEKKEAEILNEFRHYENIMKKSKSLNKEKKKPITLMDELNEKLAQRKQNSYYGNGSSEQNNKLSPKELKRKENESEEQYLKKSENNRECTFATAKKPITDGLNRLNRLNKLNKLNALNGKDKQNPLKNRIINNVNLEELKSKLGVGILNGRHQHMQNIIKKSTQCNKKNETYNGDYADMKESNNNTNKETFDDNSFDNTVIMNSVKEKLIHCDPNESDTGDKRNVISASIGAENKLNNSFCEDKKKIGDIKRSHLFAEMRNKKNMKENSSKETKVRTEVDTIGEFTHSIGGTHFHMLLNNSKLSISRKRTALGSIRECNEEKCNFHKEPIEDCDRSILKEEKGENDILIDNRNEYDKFSSGFMRNLREVPSTTNSITKTPKQLDVKEIGKALGAFMKSGNNTKHKESAGSTGSSIVVEAELNDANSSPGIFSAKMDNSITDNSITDNSVTDNSITDHSSNNKNESGGTHGYIHNLLIKACGSVFKNCENSDIHNPLIQISASSEKGYCECATNRLLDARMGETKSKSHMKVTSGVNDHSSSEDNIPKHLNSAKLKHSELINKLEYDDEIMRTMNKINVPDLNKVYPKRMNEVHEKENDSNNKIRNIMEIRENKKELQEPQYIEHLKVNKNKCVDAPLFYVQKEGTERECDKKKVYQEMGLSTILDRKLDNIFNLCGQTNKINIHNKIYAYDLKHKDIDDRKLICFNNNFLFNVDPDNYIKRSNTEWHNNSMNYNVKQYDLRFCKKEFDSNSFKHMSSILSSSSCNLSKEEYVYRGSFGSSILKEQFDSLTTVEKKRIIKNYVNDVLHLRNVPESLYRRPKSFGTVSNMNENEMNYDSIPRGIYTKKIMEPEDFYMNSKQRNLRNLMGKKGTHHEMETLKGNNQKLNASALYVPPTSPKKQDKIPKPLASQLGVQTTSKGKKKSPSYPFEELAF